MQRYTYAEVYICKDIHMQGYTYAGVYICRGIHMQRYTYAEVYYAESGPPPRGILYASTSYILPLISHEVLYASHVGQDGGQYPDEVDASNQDGALTAETRLQLSRALPFERLRLVVTNQAEPVREDYAKYELRSVMILYGQNCPNRKRSAHTAIGVVAGARLMATP